MKVQKMPSKDKPQYFIYIPKIIIERLLLKKGDELSYIIENNSIIIQKTEG